MAAKHYNTIVIGTGPGGYVCAIRLAQLGIEAAAVEKESIGGVCLNWGCIPSKAFIHVAKLYEEIRHSGEFGIEVDSSAITLNAKKLQSWKEGVVKKLTGGISQLFKANKVDQLMGQVTFKDEKTLVMTSGKETSEISFDHAVIATGGRPIEIPGFAIDGDKVIDSKGALALETIPKSMVIIGGGVIGIEMATFFAKFGCTVTVVELTDSILPGTDPDMVRVVAQKMKKSGISLLTGAKAKKWSAAGKGTKVEIETAKGSEIVSAEKILLAVGVRPNSEGLGLENIGVEVNERGFITIDETMRTSKKHIFAIGDVAGPPLLAHKASKQGLVTAAVIAGQNVRYDVRAMPAAIFSDPEIASVGMTEAEAKEAGHTVKIGKFPFAASGRALAMAHSDGFVKVVSDQESDRLLGMHIVGANASDIIAEGALAIEMGATLEDIALTVHTHPTLPEAIMEAAENAHGLAIHTVNRKSSR